VNTSILCVQRRPVQAGVVPSVMCLRPNIREPIKVTVDCKAALWHVKADPGEIGRAIMNLGENSPLKVNLGSSGLR